MTEPEQVVPGAPRHTVSDATQDAARHAKADIRRRRLLFRATHRGTAENDLMIGGFVRAHLAGLTEADLDALEAVMQMPDTDLADWLTGRVPVPQEDETPMLRRMREFLAR
jgi:antitoxin CptB